jgi:hypothetical protein
MFFSCIEFNHAVMELYSMKCKGLITHQDWYIQRQLLSSIFHDNNAVV